MKVGMASFHDSHDNAFSSSYHHVITSSWSLVNWLTSATSG